jgi:hypothetical protein
VITVLLPFYYRLLPFYYRLLPFYYRLYLLVSWHTTCAFLIVGTCAAHQKAVWALGLAVVSLCAAMADIQANLQDLKISGADDVERAKAVRALNDWKKTDGAIKCDEEDILLYLAIKKTKPATGKVSLKLFKSSSPSIQATASLERMCYIVQKSLKPDLHKDAHVKDFLIDPSSLQSLPVDLPEGSYWVVDDGCERCWLGKGVLHFKTAISTKRHLVNDGHTLISRGYFGGASSNTSNTQQLCGQLQ